MKADELRNLIRSMVQELLDSEEMEESTSTGSVAGFNIPAAFKKTDGTDEDETTDNEFVDRLNKSSGYKRVNESVKIGKRYGDWAVTQYEPLTYDDYGAPKGGMIKLVNQDTMNVLLIQNNMALRGSKWWVSTKGYKVQDKKPEVVITKAIKLNEATNRWLDLKKDESSPTKKIGVGIRKIKNQLQEIEQFINWYSKIKAESGLDRTAYWKRTRKNLFTIKERLNMITQKISKL